MSLLGNVNIANSSMAHTGRFTFGCILGGTAMVILIKKLREPPKAPDSWPDIWNPKKKNK